MLRGGRGLHFKDQWNSFPSIFKNTWTHHDYYWHPKRKNKRTLKCFQTVNPFQLHTEFLTRTFTVFLEFSVWMQMVCECQAVSSAMIKHDKINKDSKTGTQTGRVQCVNDTRGHNRLKHEGDPLDRSTWHERRQVLSPRRERNTLLEVFRGKISTNHKNKRLYICVSAENQLELKKKINCTFGEPWMDKTTT